MSYTLRRLYSETMPEVQHIGAGEYVEITPISAETFALVIFVAWDVDRGNAALARAGLLMQACQPRLSTELAAWLVVFEIERVNTIIGAAIAESMRG